MKQNFLFRHIGLRPNEIDAILEKLGFRSLDEMTKAILPESIQYPEFSLDMEALSEQELAHHLDELLEKNATAKSFIGQGYYNTMTPAVIRRNVLENPGWYTAYTPYQAEIAQGRLEALFNFQTVITELTGMEMANASLLDEGTAAAEAMMMLYRLRYKKLEEITPRLFIDQNVFAQTANVVITKAKALDIEVTVGDWRALDVNVDYFACIVQFPDAVGEVSKFTSLKQNHPEMGVVVCADLLSLTIFEPPSTEIVDVFVGSTQRLGVPIWYGGPHAAYFATHEKNKRNIPGRIIGLSKDADENPAYRMALQTREQHIKREKATSNICTAQALLAIMASFYAIYHGPEGLKNMALRIYRLTHMLAKSLQDIGFDIMNTEFFDTISVQLDPAKLKSIQSNADEKGFLLYYLPNEIRISLDETTTEQDIITILECFGLDIDDKKDGSSEPTLDWKRNGEFMQQSVFYNYRSETRLMRYMKSLENKDFSLVHGMIPLGSCTMKLNAASELLDLASDKLTAVHPFAPDEITGGYNEMIWKLSEYLCKITDLDACSLQPNSGAQGEYAGLLCIKGYFEKQGQNRSIMLIPASAHGTNPASAISAGFDVRIIDTDDRGNIDMDEMKKVVEEHSANLAGVMVTYPSTHGIFEKNIIELCQLIHDNGGLVYMDGANMNAQVGLTSPGFVGADVCHLNLHKTFAIPHGGGGPGMGPICVVDKLSPFLPQQNYYEIDHESRAVSSSEYGSASILEISYAYIHLLGSEGLKMASQVAILNSNYLKHLIEPYFDILYQDNNGRVAHEFIVDLRPFKEYNISAEDVAKRLMDYGFHAPTLSFPVPGTLMIEPTESEDLIELNRFVDAMVAIRNEIQEVIDGKYSQDDNVLVNAPHTQDLLVSENWPFTYTREKAVYPMGLTQAKNKFWPSVRRVDNAYGDRNLICSCPPTTDYMGT